MISPDAARITVPAVENPTKSSDLHRRDCCLPRQCAARPPRQSSVSAQAHRPSTRIVKTSSAREPSGFGVHCPSPSRRVQPVAAQYEFTELEDSIRPRCGAGRIRLLVVRVIPTRPSQRTVVFLNGFYRNLSEFVRICLAGRGRACARSCRHRSKGEPHDQAYDEADRAPLRRSCGLGDRVPLAARLWPPRLVLSRLSRAMRSVAFPAGWSDGRKRGSGLDGAQALRGGGRAGPMPSAIRPRHWGLPPGIALSERHLPVRFRLQASIPRAPMFASIASATLIRTQTSPPVAAHRGLNQLSTFQCRSASACCRA